MQEDRPPGSASSRWPIRLWATVLVVGVAGLTRQAMAQRQPAIWLDTLQVIDRIQPSLTVGLATWTVDSLTMRLAPLRTLTDLLPTLLPVSLRQYGNGMLSTVSIRGTGPAHSVVNWNGLSLNSPMLGQQDLSLIPGIAFDRLSLQLGSYNTVVGADAVSGALVLQTTPNWQPGLHGTVLADIGSFGRYAGQASLGYGNRSGHWSGQTGVYYLQLANDFPYKNTFRFGQPIENQTNAGVNQTAVTQSVFGQLGRRTLLALHGWWQGADRFLQPGIGLTSTGERQQDHSLRLTGQLSGEQDRRSWLIQVGFLQDALRYINPIVRIDEPSEARQYVGRLEQSWRLGWARAGDVLTWQLRAGTEVIGSTATIDAYQGTQHQLRTDVYTMLTGSLTARLVVTGQFRQGWASGFAPPPLPALGLTYQLRTTPAYALSARLHLGRTYRMPTLNDRFWQPGGNSGLRPETGWSQEGGLTLESTRQPNRSFRFLLTGYHTLIHDWILWLPQPGAGYWSPRNVQVVRSQGIESLATLTLRRGTKTWQTGFSAAYTRVVEVAGPTVQDPTTLGLQLPYVPIWLATHQQSLTAGRWTVGGQLSYTGAQATQADQLRSLKAYWLLNAQLSHRFRAVNGLTGSLQLNNLTQSTYQTIENKAMPGLNGRLQVAYAVH